MDLNLLKEDLNGLIDLYGRGYLNEINFDLLERICSNMAVIRTPFPQVPYYRARKNINEEIEDLCDPKTFSYPEPKRCNRNGRCHLIGHPVFYCSDTVYNAIFEIRPNQNDIIFISEWRVKVPILANISINVFKKDFGRTLGKKQINTQKVINGIIDPEIRGVKFSNLTNNIAAKLFIEERFPYPNSSLFSHFLMYFHDVDVINYSSVIDYATLNMAIKTEFIDKYLELKRIFKILIPEESQTVMSLRLKKIGYKINGLVSWKDPEESDKEFFYKKMRTKIFAEYSKIEEGNNIKELFSLIDSHARKITIENETRSNFQRHTALFLKGVKLINEGNFFKALKYFNKAINLCSYIPMYFFNRGYCNYCLGNLIDSKRDYTTTIQFGESNYLAKAYCNRGTIFQINNEYEAALIDFFKAFKINNQDYITAYNIGNCLCLIKKFKKALKYYNIAIKLNPDHLEAIEQKEKVLSILKLANTET